MAVKTNSTFNLNKQAKRFLATILDPVQRSLAKRAFIDAQVASETKAPKELKSGNNRKVEAE